MTDGPTGFQVAPITEDEMSLVQNILKRAVDAAMGLSQLQADVQMLRDTVQGLQADTERLRTQNANLDEALTRVRQERDNAKIELNEAQTRAANAEGGMDNLRNQVNDLGLENSKLKDDLKKAQDDRDYNALECNDLRNELKAAQGKLDTIWAAHQGVFAAMQPGPISGPTPAVDSPYRADEPRPQEPHPVQAIEDPKPEPHVIDNPGGPTVDWSKPYHWDDVTQNYVNDAPTPPDGQALPDTFR